MKILQIKYLIRKGPFTISPLMNQILREVETSIHAINWPPGADNFTLYPEKKKNGVVPIKKGFQHSLQANGWQLEKFVHLASRDKPGKVDAIKELGDGRIFALEWETGNISSSHRALNKMAVGLLDKVIAGGILVLPSRAMYFYLTDRIGNYSEIRPYFPVWECLGNSDQITEGVLAVIEVEHDSLSDSIPWIPKGTDGRALR